MNAATIAGQLTAKQGEHLRAAAGALDGIGRMPARSFMGLESRRLVAKAHDIKAQRGTVAVTITPLGAQVAAALAGRLPEPDPEPEDRDEDVEDSLDDEEDEEDEEDGSDDGGPSAGLGHNAAPDGAISKADFLMLYREEAAEDAKIEAAKARKKKLRKEAKAKGMVLANYEAWKRIEGLEEAERARFFSDLKLYSTYMGTPIGEQLQLRLDPAPAEMSDEERLARIVRRARMQGYDAGVKGLAPISDNPHDPTSRPGQAWIAGYHSGVADAARRFAPLSDAAPAEDGAAGVDLDGEVDDPFPGFDADAVPLAEGAAAGTSC